MHVVELWRYPVKTLAGERLERARLGPLGIEGDRVVHVEDEDGHVLTSRSHPRFLGHRGTLGPDGEPLVDGRPWQSVAVAEDVRAIGGPDAHLVRYDGSERFDVLPLLDPDTLVQDKQITRDIYRRFEGKLALDCFVIGEGEIAVGDEVVLTRGRGCASAVAAGM